MSIVILSVTLAAVPVVCLVIVIAIVLCVRRHRRTKTGDTTKYGYCRASQPGICNPHLLHVGYAGKIFRPFLCKLIDSILKYESVHKSLTHLSYIVHVVMVYISP